MSRSYADKDERTDERMLRCKTLVLASPDEAELIAMIRKRTSVHRSDRQQLAVRNRRSLKVSVFGNFDSHLLITGVGVEKLIL